MRNITQVWLKKGWCFRSKLYEVYFMKLILIFIFLSLIFPVSAKADENIEIFIGQLLNSKSLDGYWHIKTFPERAPLSVSLPCNASIGEIQIKKFGQPVVFTHEPNEYKNIFSIRSFNVKNNETIITFTYLAEGIRGLAVYEKTSGAWKLIDVTVNES